MIAEKVITVIAALGECAGRVSPEVWEILSSSRRTLRDAAEQAEALESNLTNELIAGFTQKKECIPNG